MTARRATLLAGAFLALALGCALLGLALGVALHDVAGAGSVGLAETIFPLLGIVPFATTGAVVASKRPDSRIGWLLLATGCLMALSYVTGMFASYDLAYPGSIAAASVIAWASTNLWYGTLVSIPFLLSRFPDGVPLSPRWRVLDMVAALLLVDIVVASFKPGPLPDYQQIDNPVGVAAVGNVASVFEAAGLALFLTFLLLATASVVVRYRRSRGVERLQLKWVAYIVGVTASSWIASALVGTGIAEDLFTSLGIIGFCCIPVSIGVAVMRYRLYDIDRVISKTVVYVSLTAVLGAAYVGLVLAGQWLFSSFAGGSNLAIAVSTLIVAALFLPLRTRVQRFVDRRFYRRRYDAQRTLEEFGTRLREQIDLDGLRADLVRAVTDTIQPSHASLWLRRGASS